MKKNKIILIVIGITLLITLLVGTSYAYWRLHVRQKNTNDLSAVKCFNIEMNLDEDTPFSLTNAKPISDAEGMKLEPYTFTIENTCDASVSYEINLEALKESTLNHSYLKVSFTEEHPELLTKKKIAKEQIEDATSYALHKGNLISGQKEYFSLRFWLDESVSSSDSMNKSFLAKITVTGTATLPTYADVSGAEAPDLDNGLIPVTWNGSNWVKADTTKTWYNYDAQWWANAINVTETTRDYYTNANPGTVIKMQDVLFMWVWIPRYEYQHTNLGDQYAGGTKDIPGGITINFISKETTTPSSENFTIHDAFWWDDNNDEIKDINEQLSGIWVAKFEMAPDKACLPSTEWTGDVNTNCDITSMIPKSVPKAGTWSGARIGTFWTAIHEKMNEQSGNKLYGISHSDTHMIKNAEWGAIAYLSQSKYGKYGNVNYIGPDKEIFFTNDLTGCSYGKRLVHSNNEYTNCAYNYDQEITGTGASSSGSIYGVYGLNGISEYVMGVMKESKNIEPAVGTNIDRNSGWSGKLYEGTEYIGSYGRLGDNPDTEEVEGIGKRYYDLYNYGTSSSDYTRGHLGDATYETKDWYYNSGGFVYGAFPWLTRSSAFGMNNKEGKSSYAITTRAVLVANSK